MTFVDCSRIFQTKKRFRDINGAVFINLKIIQLKLVVFRD